MDLKEMRKDITTLIDDIKYQSDSLTDLERLPVIQLNVLLAKINLLTRKTTILLHYVELEAEKQKNVRFGNQKDDVAEKVTAIQEEVEPITETSTAKSEPIKPEPVTPEIKKEKKKAGDIEERLKQTAIVNLTSAIGINEKYLFASMLFEGNLEVYSKAIQNLNSFENYEQANVFLDDLANQFKWDPENEMVLNFRNLVERRYYQP